MKKIPIFVVTEDQFCSEECPFYESDYDYYDGYYAMCNLTDQNQELSSDFRNKTGEPAAHRTATCLEFNND